MNMTRISSLCCGAGLACLPLPLHAQQPASSPAATSTTLIVPDAFTNVLGHVSPSAGTTGIDYSILATQPLESKLIGQKIRFEIQQTLPGGTATHRLTINTGKHKTVGQMTAFVADIFRRFMTGPVAVGQEFGKIGDVRYGGEIHFVAESADSLRYDILTPDGPAAGGGHFSRADVHAFLTLIR